MWLLIPVILEEKVRRPPRWGSLTGATLSQPAVLPPSAVRTWPVTKDATVLAAGGPEHAGIASAVNNDVARAAGLIAVATLPLVAGITGRAALDPHILSAGFRVAMWIAATLVAAGGVLSYLMIRDIPAAVDVSATSAPDRASHVSCPLDAPPLPRIQRG